MHDPEVAHHCTDLACSVPGAVAGEILVQSLQSSCLQAAVTDVAGQPAPSAVVRLRSADASDGSALASDVQLWLNDDKSFGLDFGKLEPQPGLYT